jgi:YYY domain-containing protein
MSGKAAAAPARRWLLALLALALAVRLFGINWDDGHFFHPDERRIAMAVGELSLSPWQWNPHFFAYGSLPIYVTKLASSTLANVHPWFASFHGIIIVGRALSALYGALTVLILFALGRRLFGAHVGLLAGAFLALAVNHVQSSHFSTNDVALTLLVVLALDLLVRHVLEGRGHTMILASVVTGLALATKVSAAPLVLPIVLALLVVGRRERRWGRALKLAFASIAAAGAAFLLAQPYALLDAGSFLHDVREQAFMVRNAGWVPYTNQYVGAVPVLYELRELLLWGLGPLLGVTALAGALWLGWRAIRGRNAAQWLLLAWVVPVLVVTCSFEVRFPRYLLPVVPILVLWAAAALAELAQSVRRARLVPAFVLVGTALYALAFLAIYTRPHSAVTASRWFYGNVPRGSVVLTQEWDEGFPLSLPVGTPDRYTLVPFPYYQPDSPEKTLRLAEELARADVIVCQTKRIYGAITSAHERFPVTDRYFHQLFAGQLGFRIAAIFASRPSLLGLELPSELADESFSVYDHPKVVVFEKTERLSALDLEARIRFGGKPDGMSRPRMLRIEAASAVGDTIAAIAPIRSSLVATVLVACTLECLGLVAWLLLARALGPRRGLYALAKVLGPLAWAFLSWLAVSAGVVSFGRTALWIAAVLLAAAVLLVTRAGTGNSRQGTADERREAGGGRRERGEGLGAGGSELGRDDEGNADFSSESVTPAKAGVQSSLPPTLGPGFRRDDATSSAVPSRLPPPTSGLLSHASREIVITELLVWGCFALFLLLRALNPEIYWGEKPMDFSFLNTLYRTTTLPPFEPWCAGTALSYTYFGHFVVAALGKALGVHPGVIFNLGIAAFGALLAAALLAAGTIIGRRLAVGVTAVVIGALIGNLAGPVEVLKQQAINFDTFWATSRVIPDTINEFPFWSLLFADLHAHLLALPWAVALIAVLVLTGRLLATPRPRRRAPAIATLLTIGALALAAIVMTNGWSVPTYGALVPILLLTAWLARSTHAATELRWVGLLTRVVLPTGAVLLGALVLSAPLWMSFQPPPRQWGWEHLPNARPLSVATVFGTFVLVLVPFLIARVAASRTRRPRPRTTRVAIATALGFAVLLSCLDLNALVSGAVRQASSVVFCAVLLTAIAGYLTLDRRNPRTHHCPAVLAACAFALVAIAEVVFLWDRMNTVFKLYLDAWLLLTLAAAPVLVELMRRRRGVLRAAWLIALALGLCGGVFTSVTGAIGALTYRHVAGPRLTLDGTEYLDWHAPDEKAAFEWINASVPGLPTLCEAWGPSYQEYARVAMNTGVPIVIGWEYHVFQRGRRWNEIERRKQAVATIYTAVNREKIAAQLAYNHIDLVLFGERERALYGDAPRARFRSWPDLLTPIYENDTVTLFAVKRQLR